MKFDTARENVKKDINIVDEELLEELGLLLVLLNSVLLVVSEEILDCR